MAITDVLVAGAGPAGATAACVLCRLGRSVALVDPRLGGKRAPPKPGDALPGAAARVLRAAGLPLPGDTGVHQAIGGNVSVWGSDVPRGRDFFADPDGPGWRLDRSAFEADVVAAALAAGASAHPRTVRRVRREGGAWRVAVAGGGDLRARWLVDATGRPAKLAREVGARRWRDEALVAVVGHAQPSGAFRFARTLVESTPLGWWYAAPRPNGGATFMLHTRPEDAARLVSAPDEWRASLARTHHVGAAFPDAVVDAPLRGFDACGGRLDPVWGPGWAACGDAALTFDPSSAQGLLGALVAGLEVARAVHAALDGDESALHAYAACLARVRQVYRGRVLAHYADEARWPAAAFWRTMAGGHAG